MTVFNASNAKPMPSQARLWYLFNYHSDGNLIWKNPQARRCKVGDVAGTLDKSGYTFVMVDGDIHLLHRLIYQFFKGDLDQKTQIDHIKKIEGSKLKNNRIENLRPATHSQNCRNKSVHSNNKLGVKGVSWHDKAKKYQAFIRINKKNHYLGLFNNKFDAYECYKNKCLEIDPEFYNDNDNMRHEVFLEYQDYILQKNSNIFQLAA